MINNRHSPQQTELRDTMSSVSTKTTLDFQLPFSLAADLLAPILTPIVPVSSHSEPVLTPSVLVHTNPDVLVITQLSQV